jgi:hypothetical protein
MPTKRWTLVDTERDQYLEQLDVGPADVGGPAKGYAVRKQRLRGGKRDGVDVVEIDNGTFRFVVLLTRGMGLWRAWLGDLQLGWRSPIHGPVHPNLVPIAEGSGVGWLSGFDELMCRCGLESNGAPEFDAQGRLLWPLHGRVANLPAHRVELEIDGDTGEIKLAGTVDESRFHFQKLQLTTEYRTQSGERGLRWTDTVSNHSSLPGEVELLYHVNFGPPLLDAGARAVLPAKTVVPRDARAGEGIAHWDHYSADEPGYAEQVYYFELAADEQGRTQTLLRNAHGNQGVSLHFDARELPRFTLWKDTAATADGYVTGFEPGVNFPNVRSYEKEQKRVVLLPPGGQRSFSVALQAHASAEQVAAAEKAVQALTGGRPPVVHAQPQKGWSSAGSA